MSKASCKVKFGRFRWSRPGYADVMNSGGVQSVVRQHAEDTLAGCRASDPGYVMGPVQGYLAHGYFVGDGDGESAAENFRHNTLLNNLR